ncbi:glycogenin-1-like [Notothenia coriiceps]|uniref:glycogenin glucosyltransferase n=1 Tax=Notothenia coriiceps TaxID=8208 RepID=A0A6I9P9V3_9TELE|nr:PREDICTED: glycogenin-1-like [Notothenia coriiceps]
METWLEDPSAICRRRECATRARSPYVAEPCRDVLGTIFDEVLVVDVLDSGDVAHLSLMKRPDLGVTFTKLHCWTLTHYSKCVFMDADTLVLSNIDELFEREELSAAPDPGWPDCFNSGVFVFTPSNETHEKLITFCSENGSFDGGDQGVLNSYFNTWATKDISKHLPFIYNLSSISIYSYLPAFKQSVHTRAAATPAELRERLIEKLRSVLASGSDEECSVCLESVRLPVITHCAHVYCRPCIAQVISSEQSIAAVLFNSIIHSLSVTQGELHQDVRGHPAPPPPPKLSSNERKQRWEAGQIDYMGDDSFANIERKLDSFLK